MKKILLSALCTGLILNFAFGQNTYQTIGNGNWTDPTIWQSSLPGTFPQAGDNVTIEHNVVYDSVGADIAYGNITFNTGSFTITGGGITPTIVRSLGSQWNLNIPLSLGTNARLALEGSGLNLNNGSSISYTDRTSIFSIQDSAGQGANVTIGTPINIQNGIFAIISNGGSINLTVNSGGINVGTNGVLAFEGTGGSASFSAANSIVVEEYGEMLTDLTGNFNITINNPDAIIFKSGSSLYKKGTASVQFSQPPKYELQLTNNPGWRQISSPFTVGTMLSILDGTDFNTTYPPAPAIEHNVYRWDASVIPSTTADARGWIVSASNADNFGPGQCYNIYTGGPNYPYLINGGLVQLSAPVTKDGTYNITLYNTIDTATYPGTPTEGDQGWNMIGNPYCTWLDLDAFLTDEMTPTNEYQGAHVWSTSAQNYLAYLVSGETIDTSHEITNAATGSARVIRPFQAFWVKMSSTSSNGADMQVTIDTSHRSQNPLLVSPNYFSTAFIPRLRLNAYAAADSAWDQVLVTLNPNSNKLRLGNEDAFDRPSGNDRPNMALIHEDGEKLCIDSRPLDTATVIPMLFEQGVDGATYHIGMVDDQFDMSMSAFLEDVKTSTLHDLKSGAYTFTHDKNYNQTRFNIHLAPHYVSQSEITLANNNFQIWTANDKVFVQLDKAGLHQNITVEVFDISGKLVFETTATAENTNTGIPIHMQNGAHIIKVTHPQYGSKILKTIR